MSTEESPSRRRAIPTQRGRKRQKLGGALQRFLGVPPYRSAAERHKASRGQATQG